jgi:hypothetical protein
VSGGTLKRVFHPNEWHSFSRLFTVGIGDRGRMRFCDKIRTLIDDLCTLVEVSSARIAGTVAFCFLLLSSASSHLPTRHIPASREHACTCLKDDALQTAGPATKTHKARMEKAVELKKRKPKHCQR